MHPRGIGDRIYKKGYYALLHTKNSKALGIVVSEKKLCSCFSFVSLLELSVAMETRIPALM